jgi:hypothetical protein
MLEYWVGKRMHVYFQNMENQHFLTTFVYLLSVVASFHYLTTHHSTIPTFQYSIWGEAPNLTLYGTGAAILSRPNTVKHRQPGV